MSTDSFKTANVAVCLKAIEDYMKTSEPIKEEDVEIKKKAEKASYDMEF